MFKNSTTLRRCSPIEVAIAVSRDTRLICAPRLIGNAYISHVKRKNQNPVGLGLRPITS